MKIKSPLKKSLAYTGKGIALTVDAPFMAMETGAGFIRRPFRLAASRCDEYIKLSNEELAEVKLQRAEARVQRAAARYEAACAVAEVVESNREHRAAEKARAAAEADVKANASSVDDLQPDTAAAGA